MPLTSYRRLSVADLHRPVRHWPDTTVLAGAVLLLAAGFGLRVAFDHFMDGRAPYIFLVPAVVFAAVLGGLRVGLITTALAAIAGLAAEHVTDGVTPADHVTAVVFVLVGSLFALVGARMNQEIVRNDEASRIILRREEHLRSILATIPDALIIIDGEGTI